MSPYIVKPSRKMLDDSIQEIIDLIQVSDKPHGEANYAISRIVAGSLEPKTGWNYAALAAAYACFLAAAAEFYRRMLADYEDYAIEKNGDIPEYKNRGF